MRFIETDKAAAAVGPYSQAVDTGALVFVSGQLGLAPGTGEMAPGFAAQTRQALDNLRAILGAAGLGLDAVAVVEVFLTDMGAFPEFNAIYAEFFSGHKPARAVVEVSALPKGGLVEVKCTAAR
ncbi:Rid family detoxifying hydrolase [Desulfocurvus vexinensis]|uniref:Rid family detoxifying hydrolase n=1 Tax=Desulfocurvus vexinensis TaxID=399548 RepID=UPI00048F779B|nr:Rid family detoxifying hydrolase [Desulfocurvus vexinensis]